MTNSLCRYLTPGIAAVAIGAVIAAGSVAPLPSSRHAGVPAIELTTEVAPLLPQRDTASPPELMQRGIVQGLGAPLPIPPTPAPSPSTANFADAIKNTYVAIEPWVRYGFELATYAVGWVPYVGWLSGQIMIFYNFGERIARTLVFNSADWLWGPLPFGEGVQNIARDSWDALVQLGIDEWNFFLPPLPPLPTAAQETSAPRVKVAHVQREGVALPESPASDVTGPDADGKQATITVRPKPQLNRPKPAAIAAPKTADPAEILRQSHPAQAHRLTVLRGAGAKVSTASNSRHEPTKKKPAEK